MNQNAMSAKIGAAIADHILLSERLTMRLMTEEDKTDVLAMFQEPGTFRYIKPLQDKTESEYLAFLRKKELEIAQGTGYYWMIRTADTNEFLGAINLTPIPPLNPMRPEKPKMQIGWQIRSEFQRQGFAFEAAKLAMEFALTQTDIDPILAVFVKGHTASKKILEKLGFCKFETVYKDGEALKKYIYRAQWYKNGVMKNGRC